MPGILEGIRVIEWAYYHVGPYAGALLADLGAEVIKIEDTQGGDPMRNTPGGTRRELGPGGRGYSNEADNRGKKGIALDLKHEAAREIVYRLVQKSRVFITNFRHKAAVSLGLDYESLLRYNPKLIYAHATGFGSKGEDASNPAFNMAGQARAGILRANLPPDAEPFTSNTGLGDQMGGITTAYGILAALIAQERWGIGQKIETSIMGSVLWASALHYYGTLFENREQPISTRSKPRAPVSNFYKAKDGKWLVITGGIAEVWWQLLCKTLGLEWVLAAPRYKDRYSREDTAEELVRILDQTFAQKDRDEWLRIFKEVDYPAAPVHTPLEAINDPQAIANEYVVDYDHPFLGPLKYFGSPVDFGQTPAQVRRIAPALGEHTDEVLSQLAGYSFKEIEALRAQKVIK